MTRRAWEWLGVWLALFIPVFTMWAVVRQTSERLDIMPVWFIYFAEAVSGFWLAHLANRLVPRDNWKPPICGHLYRKSATACRLQRGHGGWHVGPVHGKPGQSVSWTDDDGG